MSDPTPRGLSDVLRSGYDRRGTPGRRLVLTLSTVALVLAVLTTPLIAWWQPPGHVLFIVLGVVSAPIFAVSLAAALRGHVIAPVAMVLGAALVSLVPYGIVFSVDAGVQMLLLGVGVMTLAAFPERLVKTRLLYCGIVIVAIVGLEIVAPAGTGAVPVDDPAFRIMAGSARLAGIGVTLLAITVILLRTARAERELTRVAVEEEARANTDSLTGIGNRRPATALLDEIDGEPSRPACIALVDIDRFKVINDAGGHHVGDTVIIAVARRLDRALGGTCVVSRWGGDEFLVVSRGDGGDVPAVLERVRAETAASPVAVDGEEIAVTLSVGIAHRVPGDVVAAALAVVDEALYEAKRLGRNRVVVGPPDAGADRPEDSRAAPVPEVTA